MRINKYVAQATGLSRRKADELISQSKITVNDRVATTGQDISLEDMVKFDGKVLKISDQHTTIMLNKPVGYVCSRHGQGSKTIYDLLPKELHHLKPVGRLDKNSSGLLLLTDDGQLANELTHPKYKKQKRYTVSLDRELTNDDLAELTGEGVMLEDGLSRFDKIHPISAGAHDWKVVIHEGRNRQIRRTFAALGYKVTKLHRTQFGNYNIDKIMPGHFMKQ